MRRPTYSEIFMYKSLFWLSVLVFFLCPILNKVVLEVLLVNVSADVAYSFLSLPILIIQAVLSYAPIYAGFGVISVCVLYFGKNAVSVAMVAFISPLLELIATFVGQMLAYGGILSASDTLINVIPSVAAMLAIYILLRVYADKKQTCMNIPEYSFGALAMKHPYTKGAFIACVTYSLLHILTQAINMIIYFNDPKNYYSLPSEIGEILVEIVLPYAVIILFAMLGFVIMLLIGFMAQKIKKKAKEKYLIINKKSAE